jgi:hypothetical protein
MTVRTRTIPALGVLAVALLFWILAVPQLVEAQKAVPRGGGGQQPVKAPSDGGGGATRTPSGGGQTSSGGESGGGQSGAEKPRTAQRRPPPSDGGSRRGGETVAPREGGKSGDSGTTPVTTPTGNGGTAVPRVNRPRGDNQPTGQAVERRGRPPVTGGGGGTTIWVPGGYYGGYYPWGYGGMGLGGYYGGYYDPWYYGDSQPYADYGDGFDGQLRLKVKPRHAEVLVDGYFAGLVDEFDGVFQRLRIDPGGHRIEVRADGYEPLVFDVRIQPDRTITYTGELKELP